MAKNNKGRDYLRPLPEDIEWVEIAAILDANAINIVSHEEMIEGADACYTTAAFLKGEEQALINGIKGSLALQKSFWPVVRKKSQEDKLEFICSMIPQCITNERARQQMSKRAAALRFMTANAVLLTKMTGKTYLLKGSLIIEKRLKDTKEVCQKVLSRSIMEN